MVPGKFTSTSNSSYVSNLNKVKILISLNLLLGLEIWFLDVVSELIWFIDKKTLAVAARKVLCPSPLVYPEKVLQELPFDHDAKWFL